MLANMRILIVLFCLMFAGCVNEDNKTNFYKITLYNGGKVVAEYKTISHIYDNVHNDRVSFTDTERNIKVMINGTFVIESINNN